jgi:hypothetical protein
MTGEPKLIRLVKEGTNSEVGPTHRADPRALSVRLFDCRLGITPDCFGSRHPGSAPDSGNFVLSRLTTGQYGWSRVKLLIRTDAHNWWDGWVFE